MPCGNNADAYRRQMEDVDNTRPARRHKAFRRAEKIPVGNITKVLTANLRDMEENGLLTRETFPEVPPRVEYTLTELGCSMFPILDAMADWGTEYKASRV